MADGPEDQVLASIWSNKRRDGLLTFNVGEVSVSVTDAVVWFPFLVLLVTGWVGLVAILPSGSRQQFIDLALGWLQLANGDFSTPVLLSLIGNLVGLVLAFVLYTRVYSLVVGLLLAYTGER